MGRRLARTTTVVASPEAVFAYLDDPTQLAAHMEKPSVMMGGCRMTYDLDAGRGQTVGSHIRMAGSVFALRLEADEVVTERMPPRSKMWATTSATRLLIISGYRMGFDLEPVPKGVNLTVWIDYDLPSGIGGLLGRLLGPAYARWCVARMSGDAVRHFRSGVRNGL